MSHLKSDQSIKEQSLSGSALMRMTDVLTFFSRSLAHRKACSEDREPNFHQPSSQFTGEPWPTRTDALQIR